MTIVHATVKAPAQTLAAVADWNANHVGATIGSMFFVGAANVIQEDNANLFWDNANKRLGIWTTTPQAPIHILKDGGGGTPAISAITALIVQDTVAWGVAISIIGKDNSYIYFGDAADENVGQIKYRHNTNWMEFHVAADAFAAFRIEPSVVTVNPSQQNDIDFRVRTPGETAAIFVKASTDRVGIMTATPNVPFDVADVSRFGDSTTNYTTFSATGDQVFVGSSGLCFGEIWAHGVVTALTSVAQNDWDQILAFDTDGLSNNTTPEHGNDHIVITKAGKYLASFHWSGYSAAVPHDWDFHISKNNNIAQFDNITQHQRSATSSRVYSLSATGIIDLAVDDTIELWVKRTSAGGNIVLTTTACNITLTQIGG